MFFLLGFIGVVSFWPYCIKKEWWVVGGAMLIILMMTMMYPLGEVTKMLYSWVSLDVISTGLMILSTFLVVLMVLASSLVFNKKYFESIYGGLIVILLSSLMMSFMSSSFLLFYFSFEVSLIPTLLIILGWGYQPERLQAGVYMMMYTLLASLPLLFTLVYLMVHPLGIWMWDYYVFESYKWLMSVSDFMVLSSLVVAFLIKLPLFMVHLWLPKAHVEAPVAGSMVLAGVLLKLGGYGLSRVMMKFNLLLSFNYFLLSLSLIGMLIIGMVCCRLNDLKALVAYSSVAHMGMVVCGLFSGFMWGLSGGVMMMISHGLGSSGLFCFMNLLYERSGSRSVYINKGMLGLIPLFSLLLFLLCCSNISAPPSINLLSEIFLIISLMNFNLWSMLVFPLGSFLGAVFTFYLFSYIHHGKFFNEYGGSNSSYYVEIHTLTIHLIPVNMLVLKSDMFMYLY